MKHILVILHCPITFQGRMMNFISSLSKNYRISVFAAEGKSNFNCQNTTVYNYRIKRNIKSNILKHSLHWIEYNYLNKIIKSTIKSNIDFIICHDLPVLHNGLILKKHYQSKLIYDSLEIYNETINQFFPETKGLKKVLASLLVKFMKLNGKIAENILIKKCDEVITVNNSLARYFKKTYKLNEVKVIMNCPKFFNITNDKNDLNKQFKFKKHDKIFLYQGLFNEGRGLEILLYAFKKSFNKNQTIKLVLVGDGPLKRKLKKIVIDVEANEYIKFLDTVPYEKLLNLTSSADFGINLLEPFNLSKKYASPNKLFEYMQAEIPVLCSYSPENDLIFNKYKIGFQCDNNISEIEKGISKLFNSSKDKIYNFKSELQKAKQVYNWEKQEKVLLKSVADSRL